MPSGRISPSDDDRTRLAAIVAALGEIGFALPGSVAQRSYRCGKPRCACHGDPPRLHGPYIQWSRRVGSRTVHTNLTAAQYEDYQVFFANAARLRALVGDLEALSISVVSADPRLKLPQANSPQGGPPGQPEPTPSPKT